MRGALALVVGIVGALVLAAQVGAQPPWAKTPGQPAVFQGYWMGVDPVDGGDARRSLRQLPGGTYALAARDSFFSLCNETDRGFGSFDDGAVIERNVMASDSLVLRCLDGPSVQLRVRYELLGPGLMTEITTRADGTFVSEIIFHKVSLD